MFTHMIVLQDKFKPCCLYGRHKSITGQLRSHRFSLQRHRHVFLTSVGRHYSWFRFSIEQALTMFGSSYSIKCFWLGYSYAEILDIYYSSDQKSPLFPSPPTTFFYHALTLFSLLIYPYLKKIYQVFVFRTYLLKFQPIAAAACCLHFQMVHANYYFDILP